MANIVRVINGSGSSQHTEHQTVSEANNVKKYERVEQYNEW